MGNLVLTRREGEKIIVSCPDGTDLEVVIASIRGDKVRISLNGPKEYKFNREEIHREKMLTIGH